MATTRFYLEDIRKKYLSVTRVLSPQRIKFIVRNGLPRVAYPSRNATPSRCGWRQSPEDFFQGTARQKGPVIMPAGDERSLKRMSKPACRQPEVDLAEPGLNQSSAWTNRRATEQATRAANARQKSGRRRFVDPTTSEREYTEAEMEFMLAMSEYKKSSGRMFPTWSEVLEVLRSLGYEKITAGGSDQMIVSHAQAPALLVTR
ncbi:MAG: hypothetical protein ACHRXM_36070 [Isosphaerales bacterium]